MNYGETVVVSGAIDTRDSRGCHPHLRSEEIRRMHPGIICRNRRKEFERQAINGCTKLRPVRAIPRDDGIEVAEFREEPSIGRKFHHIEPG